MDSPVSNSEQQQKRLQKTGIENRLVSLDILRGFDMFWIVGGGALLRSIIHYLGWPCLEPILGHLKHTKWNGFAAWDLIFPLFIFISGVAMPFSFEKYLISQRKRSLYFRVIRRAIILVFLGCLYNGLLKTLDFSNLRYLSVLGLIGIAYLWASIVVINLKPINQVVCAVLIIVVYYILMNFIPVPGYGPGVLTKEANFASFIDRLIVPGKLYFGTSDPEGLLMSFPATAIAISGALVGALLKRQSINQYHKCLFIVGAGIICLYIGLWWGRYFPINKKLWTSSFVIYTTGWSLLLMAVFYLVVDVWGIKKIFFPFMLVGVNPLTIYICAHRVIDFEYMAKFFFGGLARIASEPLKPIVLNLAILFCEFVFLYILYRKKIFLKV